MKFDFCIGNPPYQEESDGEISKNNAQKPRTNIFQYFQEQADSICKETSCLVYPAGRWIHQSGKGLKNFGKNQINDIHLAKLFYFPKSRDVFPTTDISDGISVVVKNKSKKKTGFEYVYVNSGNEEAVQVDNPGEDLMPLNPKDGSVLKKIEDFVIAHELKYLHDAILPRSLFSIESTFIEQNPEKVRLYKKDAKIDPKIEVKLFTNDKSGAGGRSMWFVTNRNVIKQNQQYIDEWQVVVSSAHPGGQDGRDSQMTIIDNNSVFGRSRVALRSFKTEQEAKNFFAYANCTLIKYAFLMTDEALGSVAKRVPDLIEYSSDQKLIDFNKDINSQLYKLFNLSETEIRHIEDVVHSGKKEM